jgi:hypothetical protein
MECLERATIGPIARARTMSRENHASNIRKYEVLILILALSTLSTWPKEGQDRQDRGKPGNYAGKGVGKPS